MASSSGRQPNFAAWNRGRHLYSAGRPSRWALAHISSFAFRFRLLLFCFCMCAFVKMSVRFHTTTAFLRFWVSNNARFALSYIIPPRSRKENVAKVVGATSSEGFLLRDHTVRSLYSSWNMATHSIRPFNVFTSSIERFYVGSCRPDARCVLHEVK